VFGSTEGGPLRLDTWRRRAFESACAAAEVHDVRVHDVRHTAASSAIQTSADVEAGQRILGHALSAMALDVSAGLVPDDLDAVGRSPGGMGHNGARRPLEGRIGHAAACVLTSGSTVCPRQDSNLRHPL